ncbi:MAG: hypothetical protein DHS20C21_07540 [Gemmatimonadota bacterium]|nr:MAG: hypothetical protein DHS20C21_07540 [Gemmatimonadota bacterium]
MTSVCVRSARATRLHCAPSARTAAWNSATEPRRTVTAIAAEATPPHSVPGSHLAGRGHAATPKDTHCSATPSDDHRRTDPPALRPRPRRSNAAPIPSQARPTAA